MIVACAPPGLDLPLLVFALLVSFSLLFVLTLAALRSLQWLAERAGARRPLPGPGTPDGGA
jgi:hypothetical protein